MPYIAPYISPTAGLVIPSYADILADLISQYLSVYPSVVYLAPNNPKYQELSIFALKTSDTLQAIQLAYNARSPLTAVGSDLDAIAALCGISRKQASYSTAPVTASGVNGTIVTGGQATDTQGNVWALPSPFTIPPAGFVNLTATAIQAGEINASAGSISTMSAGLTAGWTGITNPSAATPGQPIETDSQLRARLKLSVALPSSTRLAGTVAGIAAVPGVTRYFVEENPTGATDGNGCPPHSISAIVEGGTDLDVATAIFRNRSIGCFTNGTTEVPVTDPNTGAVTNIGFSRPTYEPVNVVMTVHGLYNYTSDVLTLITAAITAYLGSLQIGETLTFSSMYAVAQSVMPSILTPQFSIRSCTIGLSGGSAGTVDIPVAYNQVVSAGTVTVTAV